MSGEALAAASGLSSGVPPRKSFTSGLETRRNVLGRQVGGTEVIDDRLDPAVGRTGETSPSSPSLGPVTPSMSARCPPAEKPIAPMRSGSIWYFLALALIKRTAALTS